MPSSPYRRGQMEFEVPSDVLFESFLGTLKSELEDDVSLDGAFAEVYARFVSLRDAYLSGRIDGTEFGDQIKDLRVLDDDGMQWTLGATTMRWYMRNPHELGQWIVAPGPGKGGIVVDATGRASGWAVEDWRERRGRRVSDRPAVASKDSRPDTSEDTSSKYRKMTIDEMFDRYVDTKADTPSFAIEESILVVDDTDRTGTDRTGTDRY